MIKTLVAHSPCSCSVIGLWMIVLTGLMVASISAKPQDMIPSIAKIGGITVGQDTMEMLQKRLGPGVSFVGQHPNSNHAWYLRRLHLQINADGFDYNDHGMIVNQLEISRDDSEPHPRAMYAHTSSHRIAFLGIILPGMKRDTVIRLLKKRLPPPKLMQDEFWAGPGKQVLGWDMTGHAAVDHFGHSRYSSWTARLLFKHRILEEIDVDCD